MDIYPQPFWGVTMTVVLKMELNTNMVPLYPKRMVVMIVVVLMEKLDVLH